MRDCHSLLNHHAYTVSSSAAGEDTRCSSVVGHICLQFKSSPLPLAPPGSVLCGFHFLLHTPGYTVSASVTRGDTGGGGPPEHPDNSMKNVKLEYRVGKKEGNADKFWWKISPDLPAWSLLYFPR